MPAGLEASDRKILLIGVALLLLMLGATVFLSPPNEVANSPVPSTYSSQPAGAEAAYLLLSRLHYPVRRWEDSPADLPSDPTGILLIFADPSEAPTEKERGALDAFVRNGGRVLFTGGSIANFFPTEKVLDPSDYKVHVFSPTLPSYLNREVRRIAIRPEAYWRVEDQSQLALFGDDGQAAVVSWELGDGEILWWAGATPLTNSGITLDDNLNFFLNSVSSETAYDTDEIYWDEYFHGERSSLWSYVRKTSLIWGLLQLCLLCLAILFTFSRRSGPVYVPPRPSRLSPLEFVDTLGGLYQRARATGAAVSVSLMRLRSALTRQMRLPKDVSDAALAQAADERLGWKDFQLEDLLRRAANAATDAKLSPRDALGLVRDLERCSNKLEVRALIRQETK